MAERATARQEWPGGHTPTLTRPAEVADLIADWPRADAPGHCGVGPMSPDRWTRGSPATSATQPDDDVARPRRRLGSCSPSAMFVAAVVVIVVGGVAAGLGIVLSLH